MHMRLENIRLGVYEFVTMYNYPWYRRPASLIEATVIPYPSELTKLWSRLDAIAKSVVINKETVRLRMYQVSPSLVSVESFAIWIWFYTCLPVPTYSASCHLNTLISNLVNNIVLVPMYMREWFFYIRPNQGLGPDSSAGGVVVFGFLRGFFFSCCGVFFGTEGLRCHGFSGVNFRSHRGRAGTNPTDSKNSLEHMCSARGGPFPGLLQDSSGGFGFAGLADGRRRCRE